MIHGKHWKQFIVATALLVTLNQLGFAQQKSVQIKKWHDRMVSLSKSIISSDPAGSMAVRYVAAMMAHDRDLTTINEGINMQMSVLEKRAASAPGGGGAIAAQANAIKGVQIGMGLRLGGDKNKKFLPQLQSAQQFIESQKSLPGNLALSSTYDQVLDVMAAWKAHLQE
jgi:hypothetical protein